MGGKQDNSSHQKGIQYQCVITMQPRAYTVMVKTLRLSAVVSRDDAV